MMAEPDLPFPSKEEVEEPLSPVVLAEASGNWVSLRHAIRVVEKACSIDEEEAQKALCRRAVVIIPVNCASWSVRIGPFYDGSHIDFSPPSKRENQHFQQTINRQSFGEILQFFRALEHGADWEGRWGIEYASWATGDFTVHLECDSRTVSLSVTGLQFDRTAIESVFSEASSGAAREIGQPGRAVGGRPRSAAWTDWIAELSSFIHEDGFPEGIGSQGQEELISRIADRLAERGLEGPSRSTVQSVVQAVLDRHRDQNS